MISVGVRRLKNELTRYLRIVEQGHVVLVTNRDRAVAVVKKPDSAIAQSFEEKVAALVAEGRLLPAKRAGSCKPFRPVRVKGMPVSKLILEDRR